MKMRFTITALPLGVLAILTACSGGSATASLTDILYDRPQVTSCTALAGGCHTGTGTVDVPGFDRAKFLQEMEQAKKLSSSSAGEYQQQLFPSQSGALSYSSASSSSLQAFPNPPNVQRSRSSSYAFSSSSSTYADRFSFQEYQAHQGAFGVEASGQPSASSSSQAGFSGPAPGCQSDNALLDSFGTKRICGNAGFTFQGIFGSNCPIVACLF